MPRKNNSVKFAQNPVSERMVYEVSELEKAQKMQGGIDFFLNKKRFELLNIFLNKERFELSKEERLELLNALLNNERFELLNKERFELLNHILNKDRFTAARGHQNKIKRALGAALRNGEITDKEYLKELEDLPLPDRSHDLGDINIYDDLQEIYRFKIAPMIATLFNLPSKMRGMMMDDEDTLESFHEMVFGNGSDSINDDEVEDTSYVAPRSP